MGKKISEWMEGQTPGSVKIQETIDPVTYWFQPFFKTTDSRWVGLNSSGGSVDYYDTASIWILYKEPKAKVKRWQWLLCLEGCPPWETDRFFKDEAEVRDHYRCYEFKIFKRLDRTEEEFDE